MWQAVVATIVVFAVFGVLASCICEEVSKARRAAYIEQLPGFEEPPG